MEGSEAAIELAPTSSTSDKDSVAPRPRRFTLQSLCSAPPSSAFLFTRANSGFLMQYFVVGLVYGGLPATMYGVFSGYLNVPGYRYTASVAMATLPWSFKAFFGALNDCVPIGGYRRKPYMAIGWALCALALLAVAMIGLPAEPYWCRDADGAYITKCSADAPASLAHPTACAAFNASLGAGAGKNGAAAEPCNAAAADAGGGTAILLALACVGYVMADVAADGLTVSYAQREPDKSRGCGPALSRGRPRVAASRGRPRAAPSRGRPRALQSASRDCHA